LPFPPNTSKLIHTIQERSNKFLDGVRAMNEALNFQASAYYFTNFQSRSLAALQPRTIKPVVTEDGSKFYYDCDGAIVYALYSTGAVVSIHPNNVAARTASGDYWMVGPNGNSFRVD
jgi:hypothetical protein